MHVVPVLLIFVDGSWRGGCGDAGSDSDGPEEVSQLPARRLSPRSDFGCWLLLAQSPSGSGRDLGTGVETAGGGLGKTLGSG